MVTSAEFFSLIVDFDSPTGIRHQTERQNRGKDLADMAILCPFQLVPGPRVGVVRKQYAAVVWIAGWPATNLGKSETRMTDILKTTIFFCFFQLLALSAETKFDVAK